MACRIIFSKSQRLYRIGKVEAFDAEETTYQTSRTATLVPPEPKCSFKIEANVKY